MYWLLFVILFFFFFQAEDGIRDRTVTGVQTCALPIWARTAMENNDFQSALDFTKEALETITDDLTSAVTKEVRDVEDLIRTAAELGRSEERRVGKECRSGWWRDD